MSQTKPSIVFAHGLWADGSCFSKLIPTLQAEGHEVCRHALSARSGARGHPGRSKRHLNSHRVLSPRW
jgi:hypothetical protein